MTSISDMLNKQLNCIQRDKMIEIQKVVERLQNKLKAIESVAEKRRQIIERLESEKHILLRQSLASLLMQIKQVLGIKQTITSDVEILSEIKDYKNSTAFWRQKYHSLCSDIESVMEKLEISQMGHKRDQTKEDNILATVHTFIRRLEAMKVESIRLCRQLKAKDDYCQTLIVIRNKLNVKIDSLIEEKLQITKERDSLKDKCFWQNSVIKVFEDMKKVDLRTIDGLNTCSKLLNINSAVEALGVVPFQTPNKSKSFDEFGLTLTNTKPDKYWLRSASKQSPTSVHTVHTVHCLSSGKRIRKDSKPNKSHKKLFN